MSGEEEREYIGLTENAFKQRYANHMSTFRHEKNEKVYGASQIHVETEKKD